MKMKILKEFYNVILANSSIKNILKWTGYLFILKKSFKIVIVLFRFTSYLLSGSFIAAFMVLYDFTSDINDLWTWVIASKDYVLNVIINTYSKLITKGNVNLPSSNTNGSEASNKKSGIESILGSKSQTGADVNEPSHRSLRNDNGYKHSIPEKENPFFKDWKFWVCTIVIIGGVTILVYYYGYYPGASGGSSGPINPGTSGVSINPGSTCAHTETPISLYPDPELTPKPNPLNLPESAFTRPSAPGGWINSFKDVPREPFNTAFNNVRSGATDKYLGFASGFLKNK